MPPDLTVPSILATQTHIGVSIWSVAGAAAILGLAAWFVVIARDIPDGRPRRDGSRRDPSAATRTAADPSSDETALERADRAGP